MMKSVRHQRGLSMVELMIALVLGTLLTLGIVQLFASNSQTYRLNEASARVQESGRMGLDILSREIRNAGYYGCAPVNNDQPTVDSDGENGALRIHGAIPNNLRVASANGSELTLEFAGSDDDDAVDAELDRLVDGGGRILVTDCMDQYDVVDLSSSPRPTTTSINLVSAPGFDVEPGARLYRMYTNEYTVEPDDAGESTLMRNGSALVSGIVDMRTQFAFRTGGSPDWRDDASEGDGPNIRGVRVSLLVRSDAQNVVETPQTVSYPGPPWSRDGEGELSWDASSDVADPFQRNLYRSYTGTAAIRNRLLGD